VKSQEQRILEKLRRAGKIGVYPTRFMEMGILQYNARIYGLREDGYNIVCERQYLPNGKFAGTHKYYLIDEAEEEPKSHWFSFRSKSAV